MLSSSHNRAYQDFLTLLTNFRNFVDGWNNSDRQSKVSSEFEGLERWFQENIVQIDSSDIELSIVAHWQSVQTEIKREFKLLATDILFFASARQNATQKKRQKSIKDRITKLIGYCQILLKEEIQIDLNNEGEAKV